MTRKPKPDTVRLYVTIEDADVLVKALLLSRSTLVVQQAGAPDLYDLLAKLDSLTSYIAAKRDRAKPKASPL